LYPSSKPAIVFKDWNEFYAGTIDDNFAGFVKVHGYLSANV